VNAKDDSPSEILKQSLHATDEASELPFGHAIVRRSESECRAGLIGPPFGADPKTGEVVEII
jgi:hypothetical protein